MAVELNPPGCVCLLATLGIGNTVEPIMGKKNNNYRVDDDVSAELLTEHQGALSHRGKKGGRFFLLLLFPLEALQLSSPSLPSLLTCTRLFVVVIVAQASYKLSPTRAQSHTHISERAAQSNVSG